MGGLVAYGELLVGVGLILGGLVGIAAFFGALMNMNFMLAGAASTNPVLFFLAVGLILAWKVAGYYGADRVLLPMLGTPWHGARESLAPTRKAGTPAARPV
jgi:thiosulfate dehydrogenase [quinone] large subunit